MEKYIDLAEFKFEFEDRKNIETRCKVGSRLYVNDEFITDSGENSSCNKKAHPAFRQDARKIACGHFQANGINLVHFAQKSPVFCAFISYLQYKSGIWASSWGRVPSKQFSLFFLI